MAARFVTFRPEHQALLQETLVRVLELGPNVAAIGAPVVAVTAVLTDSGLFSEAAVQPMEQTA